MRYLNLQKLYSERDGSVAVMTAIILSTLVLFAGGSVELSNAMGKRAMAQKALDAGVIAAAAAYADGEEKQDAIAIGMSLVAANDASNDALSLNPQIDIADDGTVTGTVAGTARLFFSASVFPDGVNFDVESSVRVTRQPVDIALVLDVSSSMKDSYGGNTVIGAMQDAALSFIDALEASGADAQVAVIPFAQTVNIGTNMASVVTGTDHAFFDYDAWAGCVFERPGQAMHSDTYDGSESGDDGKWHAYVWPPEPDPQVSASASGDYCMNSGDGTGTGYAPGPLETDILDDWPQWSDWRDARSPIKFGPNLNCTRHAITPLTGTLGDARNAVNALTPHTNWGTIVAPGIAWARRVLSAGPPFTEGDGSRANAQKLMIVLTDGEQRSNGESWNPNTRCSNHLHSDGSTFRFDPADFKLDGLVIDGKGPESFMTPYGYILDSDPLGTGNGTFAGEDADTDRLTAAACEAAKSGVDGTVVEIVTIGVTNNSGPGSRIYTLLENCASNAENFFYVDDAADLEARFEQLATSKNGIALAR